ncbi:MAG TPA: potassium-transporting ATPase subunit C, partial [Alistipes sp.]|nr:potassium-transporting ATPase subunit C [Alistipes sp.]
LDPDISPRGAQAQVRRVAEARGLDTATVRHLVDSLTQKPWLGLFGTEKVNVLRLNVALEELNEN